MTSRKNKKKHQEIMDRRSTTRHPTDAEYFGHGSAGWGDDAAYGDVDYEKKAKEIKARLEKAEQKQGDSE